MINENKGKEMTAVFSYVQQIFKECQQLFYKVDNLMAPEWSYIYGNRITKDVTANIQEPERWLVEAIFRVYESKDKLVNKTITITFWGEVVEPVITAGKIVYNDVSKRDHWDLWYTWYTWNNDNEKTGYQLDGTIYEFKSNTVPHIKEAKIFSYPLIAISDDIELESKIVKILKAL